MKLLRLLPLLALASLAPAQFYAPDTEYHDIAQRTFPVEAARVLAWQRGLGGEVKFAVETTPARETVWKITWSDGATTTRERTVRYPESLLVEGPKFYREVFAQLTGDDWKIASVAPDNAAVAFWQGAELAGVSRLEAVRAAEKLIAEKKSIARPADATRLAGILSHGALPILATQLTFDSVLLSRSAAWLCLAEAMSREPFDAPWCAIEFLAGREKAAAARWATVKLRAPEKRSAPERMWDLILRRPEVKNAFLFAARPANRMYAMPVLSCFQDTHWTELTVEISDDIFSEELLARHYDYLPRFAEEGGVAGGHFASDAPAHALAAWESALRELSPEDDGTGYRARLPERLEENDDELEMLKRLAPALNLGVEQASGPLRPTAHFTTRDLLCYGWESAGVQFAGRHRFVARRFGDKSGGKEIEEAVLGSLKGGDAFVQKTKTKAAHPITDYARLEFIGALEVQRLMVFHLPKPWRQPPFQFMRRTWLWKSGGYPQADAGFKSKGAPADWDANLKRLIDEGGTLATRRLAYREPKVKDAAIKRAKLRKQLLADNPSEIAPQIDEAWNTYDPKGDYFGYAQALEKMTWRYGTAIHDHVAFMSYVQSNALASARRFYDQVLPFISDSVAFSNMTGPMRFTLAWWEGDDAAMQRAIRDSATYSWSDLQLQVTYALHRGDVATAGRLLDAMAERYGDDNDLREMKAFLPLFAALKDSQHADHEKALDAWTRSPSWSGPQWIVARTCKLSEADAIRFLGGEKAIEANKGYIAYLKRDKDEFGSVFAKQRWNDWHSHGVILAMMRNELLAITPPAEQPDLKPADAKPLAQLVSEALNAGTTAEAAATFDPSKFKTAAEFWAGIEKLREPAQDRPDSPEDGMRRYREWMQRQRLAAAAFLKAHPADARRHDAKLMEAGAALQLARMGDRTAKPPDRGDLEAIRDAADASADARGEAEFFLVMLDAREVDPSAPHTLTPFHRKLSDFLATHGSHRRAPEVAGMQLQLIGMVETPGTEKLLAGLAANTNPDIAAQAKAVIEQRTRLAELKKKPLDLKFTADDGREVDAAKLRGKVVLLDFWASWCGPCIAEAPHIVAAFQKLHDRGFEIIGINLDDDKAAMEATAKRTSMTWPQHFDGKGWENEVAQRFGIRSIPSTWLFDKTGKLRETGLRGQELEARVENLLRE